MRILFLPNWKVNKYKKAPKGIQPPDYYAEDEKYWFFKYFKNNVDIDVIDIRSVSWIESIEKNWLRFYVIQALRAIPRIHKYDVVVSHGMQSGVVISLWRRFFSKNTKHVVFDIGAFNSASKSGIALKMMQYASKSIDGIIYHTSNQIYYYIECFPWIVNKSRFIKFGADYEYFSETEMVLCKNPNIKNKNYCICVGYSKRDWDTLIRAFITANKQDLTLLLVGHYERNYEQFPNIEQIGRVPIQELRYLIKNAKFSILPLQSYNYSFGQMTLLQQMAMGKCVIVSRVPSLIDYYINGKTAIEYEPESVGQLSERIIWVCNHDEERKHIQENAEEYVRICNNEVIMAEEIEEYLEHVIYNQ